MYIKIRVVVPAKLNPKAKALLNELASLNGENSSPKFIPLSEISRH